VSLIGDWFTLIALGVTVSRASHGSGLAISGLLLTQLLPTALVGPFTGVLADRFDRRRLLVWSDLTRAAIVLLLIAAVQNEALALIYLLALLHFTVATVFEPARSALVPGLVAPAELVSATTLGSVTWSVMTAVGGMLGGGILAAVGAKAAFAIDALSFACSAALIGTIGPVTGADSSSVEARFRDGLGYVRANPVTGAVLFVKAMAGIGLVDTFLVFYATREFPRGEGGALSLGLLWACFGVGAILGPALLNLANDGSVRRMRRLIVAGSTLVASGLGLLALAPTLTATCVAIVVRGMGGSTNWTYSTVILQKVVPDGLRGRLFAMDLALLTLAATFGSVAWGIAIDRVGVRPTLYGVAAACGLAAVAWAASLRWMELQDGRV
jgi:MFS family permease